MSPYSFREHPADVQLHVVAENRVELFEAAAMGMMEFLFGPDVLRAEPEQWVPVMVESSDVETLLIDWLSELLFIASTNYSAVVKVRVEESESYRVRAQAGLRKAIASDDIKAVTHHELSVQEGPEGWEAVVTFDV